MTNPLEVGAVIGGRYKITGHVVSTVEGDDVLTGLDQILNRQVSILVASPKNASQASQSGRELATGERESPIQVLDMVITENRPAIITNRTRANDLLDLLVNQEKPYVEPFYTDSLGAELFGQHRESAPEEEQWADDYYAESEGRGVFDLSSVADRARLSRAQRAQVRAEQEAKEAASRPQRDDAPRPVLAGPPTEAIARIEPEHPAEPRAVRALGPDPDEEEPLLDRSAAPVAAEKKPQRPFVRPAGAAAADAAAGVAATGAPAAASQPEAEEASVRRRDERRAAGATAAEGTGNAGRAGGGGRLFSRMLVGLLVLLLIVGAVFLAITQLSGMFVNSSDKASSSASSTQPGAKPSSNAPASSSAAPSPSASKTDTVKPVIKGIWRYVPSNPTLNSGGDGTLYRIVDGNPTSSWGSMVYTNANFGNLTPNFAFILELQEPADVSQLTLQQQYGSGGKFTVLVNDQPTLDGAQEVGSGTFSSTTVNVDLEKAKDKKKYVFFNVTELPRLSGIQTQYPYGMVIAELSVK